MFRGLWKLTWLEIKIFLREPLGAFGSIILPVLVFLVAAGCWVAGACQAQWLPPGSYMSDCRFWWPC